MKKTKLLLSAFVICLFAFLVQVSVSAQETEVPEGYTGIYDIADLWGIRNNPEGNYILMNDIDITEETKEDGSWDAGTGWEPIETFSGILDGNGYQIIGLNYHDTEGKYSRGGFIGTLSGGTIKNLGLKNIKMTTNRSNSYIGGIAAFVKGGTIEKCYTSGEICPNINTARWIGGIAGYITNAYSDQNDTYSTIKNCYSTCKIDTNYDTTGGIVGEIGGGNKNHLENCYFAGNIVRRFFAIAGGVFFEIGSEDYMIHCFYLDTSADASYMNDFKEKHTYGALTATQMTYESCFAGFDFNSVWKIDRNSSYKYPQLRDNPYVRVKSIQLESQPSKLVYKQGDKLDVNGAVLKVFYDDGTETSVKVTEDMLGSYDMSVIGPQTIDISYENQSVSFDIEVEEIPVSSITMANTAVTISRGKTQQLKVNILPANASYKDITWASGDASIATVDENGIVTGVQAGTTQVTAKSVNGLTAQCRVTVIIPADRVVLTQERVELFKNEQSQIEATLYPADNTDSVTWSSDDPGVASVAGGLITANRAGQTIIHAKTQSGIDKRCTVIVKDNLSGFTVSGIQNKTYTGGEIKQNITVSNGNVVLKNGTDYNVSYKNNVNAGTASVTVSGKGYYVGTQTFTFNIGKKDISNLSVSLAYSQCKYDGSAKKPGITLKNGGTALRAGGDYDCAYSSNVNPGKASVVMTGKGNYTGTKTATFTIVLPGTKIKKVSVLKNGKVQVKCKKVGAVSGYEVQYSLKKKFSGAKTKTMRATTKKLKKLKKGKKYYFRIRTFVENNGKKYYSDWSKKKVVKIKK